MKITLVVLAFWTAFTHCERDTVSLVSDGKYSVARDKRFLIYDVNHGEGFNLRRDVYMRIANAVRLLREAGEPFVLVLPPWGGLYHWQQQEVKLKWSVFFDVNSLNEFVPVMEFEDFIREQGPTIDQVVYLQPYKEGWTDEFILKYDHRECIDGSRFYKQEASLWRGWFFSYNTVRARNFECISVQGDSDTLKEILLKEYRDKTSIFVDRAEAILHQHYGNVPYWEARRSMRYAKYLIEAGNLFRVRKLSSTDESDGTILPGSFREERPHRNARGGNYVCAHWRRRDFVQAHGKELPSISGTAAKQTSHFAMGKVRIPERHFTTNGSENSANHAAPRVKIDDGRGNLDLHLRAAWLALFSLPFVVTCRPGILTLPIGKWLVYCKLNELCKEYGVQRLFLATDAPDSEVAQLSSLMRFPVVRYENDDLPDGAVAIVDQWICAHARVFIGSHVSTFSYRIQEDREILGFPSETTFNRFCPDDVKDCEQPAKWKIVYE